VHDAGTPREAVQTGQGIIVEDKEDRLGHQQETTSKRRGGWLVGLAQLDGVKLAQMQGLTTVGSANYRRQ
jgi:hypothetical protein